MTNLKNYYKLCCKILTYDINEARRSMYNNLISNSTKKQKQLGILLNPKLAEMTKTVMMEICDNL